ncbi:MAG: C26 family cysteine hydrolase domain-containing family [Gammaproteobacteria bacterium]|nr:type 1 glutamine amidotransferase [Gammaproteobacteria bacterium]NND53792.1 C26 family cysteine hydrolase domain-containing family [Gammaproteobacteria bacterium]
MQIRDSAGVRAEEYASFLTYSGLTEEQLDVLNVFDTPEFTGDVMKGYDFLFVGGASEASVLEPATYPFVESSIALLQYCLSLDIPVFASCFGFQLAVLALGGRIVRDKKDFEMGTPAIRITDAGQSDTLFHDVANPFCAVSVHKERAPELPATCILLAETDACPHAFRVEDRRFWAFQFHPEVDRATLIERLTHFKDQYTEGDDQLQHVIAGLKETPDSNALVRRFVERVLN